MKITCDVIGDLLPLYTEDMVSGDSRRIVEEHLKGCEACQKKAGIYQEPVPVALSEDETMEKVRREITVKRWSAVGCAALLVCSMFCGFFCWLYSPVYMPYSVITRIEPWDMEAGRDSSRAIECDAGVQGYHYVTERHETGLGGEDYFMFYTTRMYEYEHANDTGAVGFIKSYRTTDVDPVYYFDGEKLTLVAAREGMEVSTKLGHLWYMLGYFSAASAVIGLILSLTARQRNGRKLAMAAAFFWIYAVCQTLVCEFTYVSLIPHHEFVRAALLTVLLWGAVVLGWKSAQPYEIVREG